MGWGYGLEWAHARDILGGFLSPFCFGFLLSFGFFFLLFLYLYLYLYLIVSL